MNEIVFVFMVCVFAFIFIKTRKDKSDAELVKEFTEQSLGITVPSPAREMTNDEVKRVLRFVLSEILEILCVVSDDPTGELVDLVDKTELPKPEIIGLDKYDTPIARNAAIADGFVDMMYYMHNAACKAGINLKEVFDEVHRANMSKRFPDGTFHKNADNKVIKPPTFKEADITKVISRQMKYSGF